MRLITFIITFVCLSNFAAAQTIYYYPTVNKIVQTHCTSCHQKGMNTPFVFDSYESFATRIPTILKVIKENIMPPFPADTAYVKYHNQNVLTVKEKQLLQTWATTGMKKGKTPSRLKKSIYKTSNTFYDMELPLLAENQIPNTENDIYTYAVMDWYFKNPIDIIDYKFNVKVPYLHHSEILSLKLDPFINKTDSASVEFSNSYESKKFTLDRYLLGWFPGSSFGTFPNGTKLTLDSAKKFLMILHYIPTSKKFTDSSTLQIRVAKDKNLRNIKEFAVHGTSKYLNATNHAVFIPADSIKSFYFTELVKNDLSVFAVNGHAHHLCQNMKAYAVTPNNDTIPLLKINKWKFDWQLSYRFSKYLKIPKNSIIHFMATFDNTINNIENPNNPPKDVYASFMAADEMMELFLEYVDYINGDEKQKIKYND